MIVGFKNKNEKKGRENAKSVLVDNGGVLRCGAKKSCQYDYQSIM